jgi:hypothetical protein
MDMCTITKGKPSLRMASPFYNRDVLLHFDSQLLCSFGKHIGIDTV